MLNGKRIYLTTLDPGNAETARRWINDSEVNRWLLSGHIPVSSDSEAAWYASAERRAADRSGFMFEVHVAEDGRYIGNCGLEDVDMVHRHAEISLLIGEVSEQNKGYGRDVIHALLRFGFDTLGLHRIAICHMAPNERAAYLYRSVGFKEVGVLREHTFLRGEWVDEVALDMLASEWRALDEA